MNSLEYYYANRERVLQQIHKYYQDNKEKCKATGKAYHLKHRARRLAYFKKQENPLKRRCRSKVNYAIECGKLKRGHCEDCKAPPNEERIVGHHEDYNKPLEIVWLCYSCHMRRHSTLLQA